MDRKLRIFIQTVKKILIAIFRRDAIASFRNHFLTGLFVILPSIVTIWIVIFIFRLFGSPIGNVINTIFIGNRLNSFHETIIGFLIAISLISLIGYFARMTFTKQIARFVENYVMGLPIINSIYSTMKKIIESVTSDKSSFKSVALIEYPREGIYTLGFITKESFPELRFKGKDRLGQLVSVFVPTTPNPTSGFFLMIPRNQVKVLDMTVEEGITLVVSAGVVPPKEVTEELSTQDPPQ